jgi:hypothetical protein
MTRSRDLSNDQANLGGAVAPFVAGKNKIINGDFGVWQRGTSFSFNNASAYTADRWYAGCSNAVTVSQQAFTAGTAPVAGYESTYFVRFNRTSRPTIYDDYFLQRIEDVRTFAGQTITFSFWAKTNSGTTTLSGAYVEQWFGSGGSSNVYVNTSGALTLTTTWQRFSTTMTMPSIAGKTIGAGSFVAINFAMANSLGTSAVYDIWGVQVEAANVPTPFTTASGSIGGELALCQRYYQRFTNLSAYERFGFGSAVSTSAVQITVPLKVTMRTTASAIDYAGITIYDGTSQSGAATSVVLDSASANFPEVTIAGSIGVTTVYRPYWVIGNGTVNGSYLGFSAEL